MNSNQFVVRVGMVAGVVGVVLLSVMMILAMMIGPELANLQSTSPALFAELFANSAGKLSAMMAIDDLFVLAYVLAFAGLAAYARRQHPFFAWFGLSCAVATGALDWCENSLTLSLIASRLLEPTPLLVLHFLTQLKYLAANGAVVALGIGVWNAPTLNRAMTFAYLLFAVVNALAFISPTFTPIRFIGMFVLLILGALVLWRQR